MRTAESVLQAASAAASDVAAAASSAGANAASAAAAASGPIIFSRLRAVWYARPVPAGMRRPTMTFSFKPRRSSRLPMIAASVRTRVVSWNDAAEMNESVDSDALVMPSSKW